MLTVTTQAKAYLSQLLDKSKRSDDHAIRLAQTGEGMQMSIDEQQPADVAFEHDGKTVLVVEQQVAESLDQRELVVEDSDQGKVLAIK